VSAPSRRQLLSGLLGLAGVTALSGWSPAVRARAPLEATELLTGGARDDQDLPLIVAIHGYGDRPDHFAGLFSGFTGRARVWLPRGTDPIGEGWGWFVRRRESLPVLAAGLDAATDTVAAALRARLARGGCLGPPLVTGFSQGGMLSFSLALRHPDLVGAAFPVAGWLPAELVPPRVGPSAVPIVALHGTADTILAFDDTQRLVADLAAQGHPVELRAYEGVGHSVTATMRRDLHRLLADALARRVGPAAHPLR